MDRCFSLKKILDFLVLIDVVAVGSWVHCPKLWWMNMAPLDFESNSPMSICKTFWILIEHQGTFMTMIRHLWWLSIAKVSHKRCSVHLWVLSALMYSKIMDSAWSLMGLRKRWWSPIYTNEQNRAMRFATNTTNIPGIFEHQQRFLLEQAINLNCLTWVVSLVVVKHKRLGSSVMGYMGLHELWSSMKPPSFVKVTGQIARNKYAEIAHPLKNWGVSGFFYDRQQWKLAIWPRERFG